MPGLVLIDGGLGQLHAAAEALEAIGIINQPLASIAKREEIDLRATGRKTSPSCSTASRPCCTWSRRSATRRTASPSPSTARAATRSG